MKSFKPRVVLNVVALILIHSWVCSQEEDKKRYHGIETGSETRTLISQINGKNYRLYVNLPEGYSEDPVKEYPVFYVMDGQWNFIQVVAGYGGNHYDGFLPEIIIVGLTWGGEDPDYAAMRTNDFTPTFIPQMPRTGGAEKFIEVLRKEIIPFIDREYRTNKKDRAIGGSSFGGLITHYTLFNAPELFNGYVICNPSLGFDKGLPFKYEEEFSRNHSQLDASVFMVSGEHDNVVSFEKMVNQITSRNYEGLRLESRILEGMGHGGATNEAFARGLLSVYKRPIKTLPETELKEYTGNYIFYFTKKAEIVLLDGNLALNTFDDRPVSMIYPLGNDEFSMIGKYHDFSFKRDNDGKVTGFDMEYATDKVVTFKKID